MSVKITKVPDLGDKVKDYITGFVGIITSTHQYLYGCSRAAVEAIDKDGKPDCQWFDLQRLEVVEEKKIENHAPAVKTGGPGRVPPARKDRALSMLLAGALALLAFASPAFAKLPEVHLVEARGTTYEVKEVDRTYREKISRWNMLILKRGEEHTEYKLIGTENTLDVSTKDVPAEKRKKIPDRRPLNVKHPNLCLGGRIGMWFVTNLASSAIAK